MFQESPDATNVVIWSFPVRVQVRRKMPPIGRVYELSPCGLFILTVHTNARASQPLNVTTKQLLMTFPHIIKANLPLLTVPIKTGASFAAFVRCDLFVFHLISGIFSSHDQYRTYPAFPMPALNLDWMLIQLCTSVKASAVTRLFELFLSFVTYLPN